MLLRSSKERELILLLDNTQNKPGETLSILLNFISLVALAVDIMLKIDQREDVTPTTFNLYNNIHVYIQYTCMLKESLETSWKSVVCCIL